MENKKSKGRQKIPMEKIENKNNLYATFSKRYKGLYKKASKLATECDADIGMIIFSPAGKPFSFFHPTVDVVVSRFQNPETELSASTHLVAAHSRNKVNQLKSRLEELDIREDAAISKTKLYDETIESRQRGWWESIEELNAYEVTKFEGWLDTVNIHMQNRMNQLENGASSSLG